MEMIDNKQYLNKIKKTPEYWKQKLETCFSQNYIDDITDLNYSTCFTYLVSLNKNNEGLNSMDLLLKEDDSYFMEILISSKKPLITMHFWKYPQNSEGKILKSSEEPYLKNHEIFYIKYLSFVKENDFILLNNKDLRIRTILDGDTVSLYYNFFSQEGDDKLGIPY